MNYSKKKLFLATALSAALTVTSWTSFAQHSADAEGANPHDEGHGSSHPDNIKMMKPGSDPHKGMGMQGPGHGMGHTPLKSFENTCMNPMGHEMGMAANLGSMGPFSELNITKEQQQKIRDIRREFRKNHWELSEQIFNQCDALAEHYATDKPDFNAIGQAYGKIAEARYKMMQQTKDVRNRIIEIFTDEQREQLRGMNMEMMNSQGHM